MSQINLINMHHHTSPQRAGIEPLSSTAVSANVSYAAA